MTGQSKPDQTMERQTIISNHHHQCENNNNNNNMNMNMNNSTTDKTKYYKKNRIHAVCFQKRKSKILLLSFLFCALFLILLFDYDDIVLYQDDTQNRSSTGGFELVSVYTVQNGEPVSSLRFLDQVDVANQLLLDPEPKTIDEAHRMGLIHTGAWMFLTDINGYTLLLRRGPQLVTCPNAWGPLGEHTLYPDDEKPKDTVIRAIREELGIRLKMKTNQDHNHNINEHNDDNSIVVANVIEPLTEHPVYYLRDYGPTNGGRVDRQVTYIFWVQLDANHKKLQLLLDDEVAEHKWMTLDNVQEWLSIDIANDNNSSSSSSQLKFCHSTLLHLLQLALNPLNRRIQERNKMEQNQP